MDLQEAEDMLHTFWIKKADNVIGKARDRMWGGWLARGGGLWLCGYLIFTY